jgi:hypothetical protein
MIDVAEHPATTSRRIAPYLLVGVLAAVPNALGLRTGSWRRPREPDRHAMGSRTDPR